jgi:hypothetical protein
MLSRCFAPHLRRALVDIAGSGPEGVRRVGCVGTLHAVGALTALGYVEQLDTRVVVTGEGLDALSNRTP